MATVNVVPARSMAPKRKVSLCDPEKRKQKKLGGDPLNSPHSTTLRAIISEFNPLGIVLFGSTHEPGPL